MTLFSTAFSPTVLIGFLVLFPLLTAGLLLVVRGDKGRSVIVVGSAILISLGSILLAAGHLTSQPWRGGLTWLSGDLITWATIAIDLAIAAYILVKSIKHKKPLAAALAVTQALILLAFELSTAHSVTIANDLYIDPLSVIMALVIGIIGSGICVYSLGYMKDFQAHANEHAASEHAASEHAEKDVATPAPQSPKTPPAPDRRPTFFALMFLFLSAMFALVFANNLSWLLCAWEVTTVCSFALIGYTRTAEAINNSFRQIVMNLLGGLAFAIAVFYLGFYGIGELDALINLGSFGMMALPIALIAFAGMTKAAQMPFQSWLLGAMVAPTPTSALLHSSTMVKAGVFLIIKCAPALGFNTNGIMVMLVGGITFLFCSGIAISQSNAKRVLAYSTVANLGLIVACAGVGTPEAVWAAIFLLIFHAAAKSLLFLCVGTAEHHIDSRDIEDMDNLFIRMPALARLMALGILIMFAAPFGMLISKWATIVSLVETNNLTLLLILAFGSAATFMFWAKWLGKLLGIAQQSQNVEKTVHRSEWTALTLMAVLAVGLCIGFPFISEWVVVPYLLSFAFMTLPSITSGGVVYDISINLETISFDNLLIMATIVLALLGCFAVFLMRAGRAGAGGKGAGGEGAKDGAGGKKRTVPVYLAGVGLDFENRTYRNSLSGTSQATQRNWYLDGWFGERVLTPVANITCIMILLFGAVFAVLSLWGISL
jgi:ech hydrogenase subunit A